MKIRLTIAALLLALATPAHANDKSGCFARVYDKTHLAKHPDQLVTAAQLHIYPAPRDTGYAHWFKLRFQMRGRVETLQTEGYCTKEGPALNCHVEGDGGGVQVEHRAGNVRMSLDRITVTSSCGSE
jgi:hypothetical protein